LLAAAEKPMSIPIEYPMNEVVRSITLGIMSVDIEKMVFG
jgi:hypothetical protein